MKYLMIIYFSVIFLSCDKDNNGVIDGTEALFCWECIYSSTATVSGHTESNTMKAEICNMNEKQIRQYEKDNSKTTNYGSGASSTLKVKCSK